MCWFCYLSFVLAFGQSSVELMRQKFSDTDYVIRMPERKKKSRLCHVNMLKQYFVCENSSTPAVVPVACASPVATVVSLPHSHEEDKFTEFKHYGRLGGTCVSLVQASQKRYLPPHSLPRVTFPLPHMDDCVDCVHITHLGLGRKLFFFTYRQNISTASKLLKIILCVHLPLCL